MSRTRRRVALLILFCFLAIGAAVGLRQWIQRWTEAAPLGLDPAEVEDRQELAALWRKPAIKPVSTTEHVHGHGDYVIDMRFAADGRTLRSVGRDNTVCTWDTATMKMLRRYSVPGGRWIASIRPSDGRYAMCVVLGTGNHPIQVLDLETGTIVCEVPPLPPGWAQDMRAWEDGGDEFFWLKEPEAMWTHIVDFRWFNYRWFNYLTGKVLSEGKLDFKKHPLSGEPTEDGTRLFCLGGGGRSKGGPKWWTAGEILLPGLEFRDLGIVDTKGNPRDPFGLVPGGKYFYIEAQIFDRQSLKRVATKEFADGFPSALSFNADGSRYVTVVAQDAVVARDSDWCGWAKSDRPILRVQETLTGRTLLAVPLSKRVTLSRLAPDGRQLAAALSDGTIQVWQVP
jgi:WD40 repeat protein